MGPEIPDGYVLTKKGGRPKAIAKHLAVFMARLYYTEKLGKAYLADSELMKVFDVSDPSVLRRMVQKAVKVAKRGVTAVQQGGWVLWVEGSVNIAARLPVPIEGGECWLWCEGMKEALPGKTRNVRQSVGWRQSYPDR